VIRERSGRNAPYGWLRDASGLVSLAQIGALEIHVWGARIDAIEKPDRIVFDLDPDPDLPWERVVRGAVRVRERLAGFGLKSFVKTTGGKGLHIVVPLLRRSGWEEVLAFSRAVALGIARENPGSFTGTASKAQRKGKIYIDVLRNARGATSVAPYSPRARPGAPVSMPVGWEELGAVRRGQFTVADLQERLRARRGDPWDGFQGIRQGITKRALSAAPAA
jgi:bifunctional non-homologous end joining protein LigD